MPNPTLYYENLEDKIYNRLKVMILDKALRPGERLQLAQLGAEMGVSRTPLVNALKRLSAERLVEWVSRYGIYVRRFTAQEMVDLYEIRVALESLAARLAAERATAADIDRLEKCFGTSTPARLPTPCASTHPWIVTFIGGSWNFRGTDNSSRPWNRSTCRFLPIRMESRGPLPSPCPNTRNSSGPACSRQLDMRATDADPPQFGGRAIEEKDGGRAADGEERVSVGSTWERPRPADCRRQASMRP